MVFPWCLQRPGTCRHRGNRHGKSALRLIDLARLPHDRYVLFLTSISALCVTLYFYGSVHVWYHDAATYLIHPTHWIIAEGRWLNYILFPVLKELNGQLSLFLTLLLLFLFLFASALQYIKSVVYAFAFATLCIQAAPLVHQLVWPSSTLPSIVILAIAASTARMLPTYGFYVLFGALLVGSIQSFYYLLPLLHLPLLTGPTLLTNLRCLALRILLPWVVGFISGILLALIAVYVYTLLTTGDEQLGLRIDEWRRPEGDWSNWNSWNHNTIRSINSLIYHVYVFVLYDIKIVALIIISLTIALSSEVRHLAAKLLCAAMIVAHYVVIVPIGVQVDYRTSLAAALGFAALLFLTPQAGRLRSALQSILLSCISMAWCAQSINALHWQTTLVDTYYNELLLTVPMKPSHYKGIVLLSDSSSIAKATSLIERRLELPKANLAVSPIMHISTADLWAPVAREAGFRDIKLCGKNERHSSTPFCGKIAMLFPAEEKSAGLYTIVGTYDGYIVLSVNTANGSLVK